MSKVLLGFKRYMVPIPWFVFTRGLQRDAQKSKRVLGGLDEEHRSVHHFVVRELPRLAAPMPPEYIADGLALEESRVIEILDELERRLIFIFRPGGREVVWAYPVTVEPTPHKVAFSSGERLWAA
ncbi:MAG: hypothetical protein GY769_25275 [bacterium]|nr:hypothetical protein [bacterium]